MPTYVYKFVKTGETIEVVQSFADAPLTQAVHPRTKRKMAVKKVYTPVGVTFRGDGFYKTDSRKSKSSKVSSTKGDGASSTESTSSSDSSTPSSDGKADKSSKPSASSSGKAESSSTKD